MLSPSKLKGQKKLRPMDHKNTLMKRLGAFCGRRRAYFSPLCSEEVYFTDELNTLTLFEEYLLITAEGKMEPLTSAEAEEYMKTGKVVLR